MEYLSQNLYITLNEVIIFWWFWSIICPPYLVELFISKGKWNRWPTMTKKTWHWGELSKVNTVVVQIVAWLGSAESHQWGKHQYDGFAIARYQSHILKTKAYGELIWATSEHGVTITPWATKQNSVRKSAFIQTRNDDIPTVSCRKQRRFSY